MPSLIDSRLELSGPEPIHAQIRERVLRYAKTLSPGAPLPTEKELCDLFKVSHMTVRKAIGKLVEQNVVVRLQGKGTFLKEGGNRAIPIEHNSIGIIAPRLKLALDREGSPTHFDIFSEVEKFFVPLNFSMSLFTSQYRSIDVESLRRLPLGGVVVINPFDENIKLLEAVEASGKPFVTVNCFVDMPGINRVNTDVFKAGQLAAEHLIRGCRRKICFVGRPENPGGATIQYRGYESVVRSAGIDPVRLFVEPALESSPQPLGDACIKALEKCDGVVASEDDVAIAVMGWATSSGRSLPGDLAVVGYFDSDAARTAEPPLTSIRMPSSVELGHRAARRLMEIIKSPKGRAKTINLAPKLIARASS